MYAILVRHTSPATMGMHLAQGASAVDQHAVAIGAVGGSLVERWLVLDDYELLLHADFPSDEAALAYRMLVASSGSSVRLLRLMPTESLDNVRDLVVAAAEQVFVPPAKSPR